tara:strand:- start:995 stop:1849 length:855 start_codon:yes stop_codon:yes gene_type:complete
MSFMKIGSIGQGFVGKNTADNFEARGYEVVRYSLEPEYINNDKEIAECDIVFVAVPTPSTPEGFDASIIEAALGLVATEGIVVIKSTILPGLTSELQAKYPKKTFLFSPEFLSERTAAEDVANPIMNIIGIPLDTEKHKAAANEVLGILPKSEHAFIISSQSAELFKYAHNLNGYFRVILANLLYEVAQKHDCDWGEVKAMMDRDSMMSPYYNDPVHNKGRGAGGNCFIKDMAAFRHMYTGAMDDPLGLDVLHALEKKNVELLTATNKDLHLLASVYGENYDEK